jgi:hypothetical protein
MSELKMPDRYWPVAAVKLRAQSSHGKFVPVVERTVKGPLKICSNGDGDVVKLSNVIVLVVT